jgi:hypothetical protein
VELVPLGEQTDGRESPGGTGADRVAIDILPNIPLKREGGRAGNEHEKAAFGRSEPPSAISIAPPQRSQDRISARFLLAPFAQPASPVNHAEISTRRRP